MSVCLDRFSHHMSWEYASKECPYCDDYPCTCYRIEDRERMDEFVSDSWDNVGEPI